MISLFDPRWWLAMAIALGLAYFAGDWTRGSASKRTA